MNRQEERAPRPPPRKIAFIQKLRSGTSPKVKVSIINENYTQFNTFAPPSPDSDEENFVDCDPPFFWNKYNVPFLNLFVYVTLKSQKFETIAGLNVEKS